MVFPRIHQRFANRGHRFHHPRRRPHCYRETLQLRHLWQLAFALFRPLQCRRPKTVVRWLCLRAFVYLGHTQSQNLPTPRLNKLIQAVELGVFLNRWFDKKEPFNRKRYRALRTGLPAQPTQDYLKKLRTLERHRPEMEDWPRVFLYRRTVLEISLSYLFTLSGLSERAILLPLCSLIQLTDDVLDKRTDEAKALPTFLTSPGPPAHQLALQFWEELRRKREPHDTPIVAGGWLAYLLCRVVILCSPS